MDVYHSRQKEHLNALPDMHIEIIFPQLDFFPFFLSWLTITILLMVSQHIEKV